jgi:membrane-associated phospholipid phosphatase
LNASISAAAEQRSATNRLFAAYLLLSAPAMLFPNRPPLWWLVLAIHVMTAAALIGVGRFGRIKQRLSQRFPRSFEFIADWYLLALVPLLYTELAVLNAAVWHGRYFDELIIGWEQSAFRGQPSRELAMRFPSLALSEILHSAYLSYYLIIYAPFVILYAQSRREAHRVSAFAVMLAFFAHYLFFIYFPVQGPRYLYPAPGGALADGSAYQLTHRLLEAGSSRGAAFPSSHVGVSIAQTIMVFRFLPRLGPPVLLATIALAVGAVYGGFHYAIDATAGFLVGTVLALIAPRLRARWNRRA